jgi:signal transduction histidine kinase
MQQNRARSRLFISFLTSFLLIAGVVFRAIPRFYNSPLLGWLLGLLLVYTALFALEWWVSHRLRYFRPVYFVLQMLIILALLFFKPPFDFFCVLLAPLTIQAFWYLPSRTAAILTAVGMFFVSAPLIANFDLIEGLGYVVTYGAVLSFISVVCVATLRAEQADAVSQSLLAELREAHRKLQDYANQIEELAAAEERNRLARELHDSVTQTIFSMTLTAQAARILIERDPARLPAQLDRLQSLAQSALAEMRTLIQQMHPLSIVDQGLALALRRHVAERKEKDGLNVDLQINGEKRLPAAAEESLFRVVQEALNNVIKHAHTDQAFVSVNLEGSPVIVLIEDRGVGFDPARIVPAEKRSETFGHLGLSSMAERIQALGGRLAIESRPGQGTCVRVEINPVEEPDHV